MRIDQDFTGTPVTIGENSSTSIDDPLPSNNTVDSTFPIKPLAIMPADSSTDYHSIYNPVDQDGHPYVGLVNQAMTCYLNSLIQALFMTPEFRNILYEWQFSGTMEEASRNIPFQLQKLFALLQTTLKPSLETKDLTASFGWEGSDAYEQHDVQELSRVMLEALEHRFRKSEQHRTFIQNLYKGTMEDFVKCLGCQRESVRQDIFNDLALAVREFGATESYKSVEEALQAFIKVETLSGSNKYKCENCGSYQDAEKGFRFTEFPYMLVIQLKRFTVDYTTGFRVKLNDTMTFPDYLDLNSYLSTPETKAPPKPKISYASMTKKTASPPKADIKSDEENFPSLSKDSRDFDGWLNKPPTCNEVQEMIKKGSYVYELFAIMIHQGSATGGHYFAYIKNLEQSKWLCFNDTQVKAVDLDEVKKSFGGTGWASNTNAYLMMYRQIDPAKNQKFTRNVDLPDHVIRWLKQWEEEEHRQATEQQRIESLVKVRVVLNDERTLMEHSPYGALEHSFPRDTTGKEIIRYFCQRWNTDGVLVSPDSCILIPVNNSFNYKDEDPVDLNDHISEHLKRSGYLDLNFIMETKKENFNLPICDDGFTGYRRTIDILTVDVAYNTVRMCKRFCVYDTETLASIRNRICALVPKCHLDDYPCRMVLDSMNSDDPLRLIDDYEMALGELVATKFQISRFFIDCGTPDLLAHDRSIQDFIKTQMCKIIEKEKYGFRMRICLPTASDYRQAGLRPPSSTMRIPEAPVPSPPVSPISKKFCQLGPLNETAESSIDNRISQSNCLYTTAKSQMVVSSTAPVYNVSNTITLNRFINACPTADPPSYDECVQKDPRVSPIEGASSCQPSPLNFGMSDTEMDVDCPGSANISPNVSDNEENKPPAYDDVLYNRPTFEEWTPPMNDVKQMVAENIENLKQQGSLDASSAFITDDKIKSLIFNDAYHDSEYTVDVLDSGYADNFFCNYLTILIDSRQYTTRFVEWIARYLNLQSENIALAKHYSDTDHKGYDVSIFDDDDIKGTFASVNRVSVNLRVPTQKDEKLVRVVEFDLQNDSSPDSWPTLFSAPASFSGTIADFKLKCQKIMESAYAEKIDYDRIRLREITTQGAPILHDSRHFGSRVCPWDSLVALQRLKPEEVLKFKDLQDYQPVIVRRFCPSTLEIMAPFEVFISEKDPKGPTTLKKAIADHAKLMPERIGLSELLPKGTFARWPFTKTALDLLDLTFAETVSFGGGDFGGKVIYFVDKMEQKKHLSEDERRSLRIRERISSSNNTIRRTERPLRIQMSSISESEP